MLRKIALLSTSLLYACGSYSSPAPNIVSIEPEEVVSGEASTITLELDAPLPVKVDYGQRTATVLTPTVLIGGQKVAIALLEQKGMLRANVPTNLPAGPQEVRLEMEDGNESHREQELTVLPVPPELSPLTGDTDPGNDTPTAPEITGLSIDPIADQVRDVPFVITLRAEGPAAASFAGQVQISSNKGRVSPNLSNAFSQGVRREQVVLDKQGGQVVLTVRVGKDIVAQSNPFKVAPK
ncbi:hypothetical protein JQX13_01750 [Archangium violaceum]|uniref:hypothetical protein n=1 Tax=Archangium violaceum TaxID=83451 RepID=UPI00193BEE57|nr:hypothetical protein [Archangium violaceum]QRK08923.1 hypothetical protein JQX13_01750 [Archangium violaceum]